jgi:hypothetical protein
MKRKNSAKKRTQALIFSSGHRLTSNPCSSPDIGFSQAEREIDLSVRNAMVHLQLRKRPAVNKDEKIRSAALEAQRLEDSAPVVIEPERRGVGAVRRAVPVIDVTSRSLSQAYFSRKTPRRVSERIGCVKTDSSRPWAAMCTRKVQCRNPESARMARTRKSATTGRLLMAD